ncbi:hypothetical protein HPP92_019480 [Vanilla planifolia]|uniref:BAG family molecular chaperone regulator 8, chloroplastic n=1 Tax=Vanilla planifolia TaxID=51239 RepID=A0A835Q3E2_VANPL|nr:hypothetical protein HPP92_019480 [Vanilla planifolia]
MPPNHYHHHNGNYEGFCSPPCCSSCCRCSPSASPLPIPSISADQLLQSMATQLLYGNPTHGHLPQTQTFLHSHQLQTHKDQQQTQALLHSLVRRVAALESSLSRLSLSQSCPSAKTCRVSTPSSPPRRRRSSSPPPAPHTHSVPPLPLREVAARMIQARFRQYLVRRSQTLRDLKRLASFRAEAATLRSVISGKAVIEPEVVSQRITELILQLSSIQISDSMIREGKRSVEKELVRMLEFTKKVLARERLSLHEAIDISGNGQNGRDTMVNVAVNSPFNARAVKRVSFEEKTGIKDDKPKLGFSSSSGLEDEGEGFIYENGEHFHDQGIVWPLSSIATSDGAKTSF